MPIFAILVMKLKHEFIFCILFDCSFCNLLYSTLFQCVLLSFISPPLHYVNPLVLSKLCNEVTSFRGRKVLKKCAQALLKSKQYFSQIECDKKVRGTVFSKLIGEIFPTFVKSNDDNVGYANTFLH